MMYHGLQSCKGAINSSGRTTKLAILSQKLTIGILLTRVRTSSV